MSKLDLGFSEWELLSEIGVANSEGWPSYSELLF